MVSIIVPVYNAEKYLGRCVDSLINQSYPNIQIILINDGSNDKSEKICLEYVSRDSRITYIFQENSGVGIARNNGLRKAEGDYVCFVDADDYVNPHFVQCLLNNIERYKSHMAICGFSEVRDSIIINETKGEMKTMLQQEAMTNLLREDGFKGYVWNKMFCMDIIREHGLEFDSSIAIWEDVLFDFQYMLYSDKIVYDPTPLYYYVYNDNSSSHERNHILGEEKAYSAIRAQKEIEQLIPCEYQSVEYELGIRYMQTALAVIRNTGYLKKGKKSDYYIDSVNLIKKYKKKVYSALNKKDKILVWMVLHCPNSLLLMYRIKQYSRNFRECNVNLSN